MKPEMFKTIEGFPAYEISNYGIVRSWVMAGGFRREHPKRLKLVEMVGKYLRISLYNGDKKVSVLVHSLVLTTFIGPRPKGFQACHNDGNPQNNYVGNLRWDTQVNNFNDQIRHGTRNTPKNKEI